MQRILLLASTVVAACADGADVTIVRPGESLEARDVREILERRGVAGTKTRGIRKVTPDMRSTLALRIQFGLDSVEIPAASLQQLDAVAEGIRSLPGSPRLLIEGHTDAVGTETYNAVLSTRRADVVRAYLIGRGVSPAQLEARGVGSRMPLANNDSRSPENRRVEFHRLD